MSDEIHALAARFFAAIEASDVDTVREIYHPDCVIWHNYDPLEVRGTGQTVTENLKVLVSLPKRILGAKYDVVQREATETGFIQQHVLRGTMLNGEPFILPACLICVVKDGRITRLDEYFDPAISAHLYEVTEAHNANAKA
jgi:ketosteroid isomerase-like protein